MWVLLNKFFISVISPNSAYNPYKSNAQNKHEKKRLKRVKLAQSV